MLDVCAELWWSLYKDMPYAHGPDGYPTINTPPIGKEYFVKHLKASLSGCDTQRWAGEVTDDSIVLAEDEGKVKGILVCSTDHERLTGNILSAYMRRDARGLEIADGLLNEALERFRKMGLHRVVAGPGGAGLRDARTLEAECPIHLVLFDERFAWNNWSLWSMDGWQWDQEYCVFLGGSLDGFRLRPEITEKIEKLCKDGIVIERVTAERFNNLQCFDPSYGQLNTDSDVTFVALVDDFVIGWLSEVRTWTDEYGRVMGIATPNVIPIYRRRGIGKVLCHLGTEEVVRQGAQYGWGGTEIHSPGRLIYRSLGYRYW